MPPSTGAACGRGAKMCAGFGGLWIIKSWYFRSVSIKLAVSRDFRSVHHQWRTQRETAHFMNQNGDHRGSLALYSQVLATLITTGCPAAQPVASSHRGLKNRIWHSWLYLSARLRNQCLVARHRPSPGFRFCFTLTQGGTRRLCCGRWERWGRYIIPQMLGSFFVFFFVSRNVFDFEGALVVRWRRLGYPSRCSVKYVTRHLFLNFCKTCLRSIKLNTHKKENRTKKWRGICTRRKFLWQAHS